MNDTQDSIPFRYDIRSLFIRHPLFLAAVSFAGFFAPLFLFSVPHAHADSYYNYNDTILVVNDASATSTTIANYFIAARSFPASHVVHINTPAVETISTTTFKTDIQTPVENFLTTNNLASSTNYIITTKGVPLDITIPNVIPSGGPSVDQALSLILGKYSSDISFNPSFVALNNPYYNQSGSFSSVTYGFYIVTRLTGYTIADVESMIDRSAISTTTTQGTFVLDTAPGKGYSPPSANNGYNFVNGEMVSASSTLDAMGFNVKLDLTNTYLTYQDNVLGYYSWGSNDGNATTTNSIPYNTWINGSIGDTAVSTSGRTFNLPATYGQSLIADWLAEGMTGGAGYTSEPYTNGLSNPATLFPRYASGYNLADSFGMAFPEWNWKEVIVGDPKMVIVKHLPFDITAPADNAIASSTTPTFSWQDMVDYYGISKYELYIDGSLAVDNISATTTIVSTPLSAGTHTWYVKAVDNNGATATSTSTFTLNVVPGYAVPYTFYVDNVAGNDNNPGSQAAPWATLAKAGETVEAGDTVKIVKNSGVPYRETLSITNSGTASLPITFEAADATQKPEIWGSTDESGGWSVYSGGNANTYEKAVTATSTVLAAGATISSLTARTEGASAATLPPGAWYFATSTLYYRLGSGEDISTLHIEAGTRNYGVYDNDTSGDGYHVFNNIIARYANVSGFNLPSSYSTMNGVEAYGNYAGISLNGYDTLQNSIAADNTTTGISMSLPQSPKIYNNLSYGNGGAGFSTSLGAPGAQVKNNIVADNGSSFKFPYPLPPANVPGFTASNNNWDVAGDTTWETTYKGVNNQEDVNPLLSNPSANDFSLNYLSPDIDAGTSVPGRTTDILGNPIYGTPDIGPYEYQPPYMMGTDPVERTGDIRIYANGKYRYTTATSSAATAALTVTPVGGFGAGNYAQWMDIGITTWDTSGDYKKVWTESSPIATSTVHTVGDLASSTTYGIAVDGTYLASSTTNTSGSLTFTYTKGYTTHTFTVANDAPAAFSLVSPSNTAITNSTSFSWNPSSDSWGGLSSYVLYLDGTAASGSLASTTTSFTLTQSPACNTSHNWYVAATDVLGQTTDSNTYSFTIPCNSIGSSVVSYTGGSASVSEPPPSLPPLVPVALTTSTTTGAQGTTAPLASSVSPLSHAQIESLLSLLSSFGASADTIAQVEAALLGGTSTPANTTPPHASCVFTTDLSIGSRGEEVRCLQQSLIAMGYAIAAGATGYFGDETRAAVGAWQRDTGVRPSVGYFGPISRAKWNSQ